MIHAIRNIKISFFIGHYKNSTTTTINRISPAENKIKKSKPTTKHYTP